MTLNLTSKMIEDRDEVLNHNLACHKHYHGGVLRVSGRPGESGLAFVFGGDERKGAIEVKGGASVECGKKELSYWDLIEVQNFANRRPVLMEECDLQDIFDDIGMKIWDVGVLLEPIQGIPNVDEAKDILMHLHKRLDKEV